jgi:hypothetical protein
VVDLITLSGSQILAWNDWMGLINNTMKNWILGFHSGGYEEFYLLGYKAV